MTPKEQEALFRRVRKRYPDWSLRQASGYVHGVMDGFKRSAPRRAYIRKCQKDRPYALGYIKGFVDAFGPDALFAIWAREVYWPKIDTEFLWWKSPDV